MTPMTDMAIADLGLRVLLSYLLGSVLGSMLVGRLYGGIDIRTLGSGNAGGTNALRTQGRLFGTLVLCIDFAKGALASGVLARVSWPGAVSDPALQAWLPVLCGIAVLLGHVYPLWFGFRGGKGIATGAGAIAGIQILLLLPALLVWLVTLALSGYVSLASMCAALALPVATLLWRPRPLQPLLWFGVLAAVFVIYTHRANIARLRAGSESRHRLLRRRAGGSNP